MRSHTWDIPLEEVHFVCHINKNYSIIIITQWTEWKPV